MADVANGTQFSDLPSYLAIEILVRLPVKALLICRYVRKDWTRLYFSDPYFIRRQLETSNIHFLDQNLTKERKFRFGWFVDEVSTGNLRIETLDDFSCNLPHDPTKYEWRVINSCNGLLCLRPDYYFDSSVYVCNPILGECVCIPVPDQCFCALGFSAKNNQYKILSCQEIGDDYIHLKYEWKIYTLGTGHWRSIETNETLHLSRGYTSSLDFNTFLHGSLHWIDYSEKEGHFVVSFDFETERFTVFPLPMLEDPHIQLELQILLCVTLCVVNGCLWVSFYNPLHDNYEERVCNDGEMWAMKEYGDEKSWTMMLAMRDNQTDVYDTADEVLLARHKELGILKQPISLYNLLYALSEDEMLIHDVLVNKVFGYNSKTKMRSREMMVPELRLFDVIAYNPSFVSLTDFERGEQVIRGRDVSYRLMKKRLKKISNEKQKKNTKKKQKKNAKRKLKRVWF